MASLVLEQLDRFGPDHCEQLTPDQAQAYVADLVRAQYENFSVVSCLLPRSLRPDFANVYAFCRWADDLGDETGDPQRSLELLTWWRRELDQCYQGAPRHPVFVALSQTIARHELPRELFADLIDAFIQDQRMTRYRQWDELLDYCTRSANPVGRLVLYMFGHRDMARQQLSDATCTALQLANFWQDVRRDILERDRIYIPADIAARHGLDLPTLVQVIKADQGRDTAGVLRCGACPVSPGIHALLPAYQATVRDLTDRTWPLFVQGRGLWPLIEPRLRDNIRLFSWGGESVLRMIEKRNYDTMTTRPSLSKASKLWLIGRCLLGRLWPPVGRGRATGI